MPLYEPFPTVDPQGGIAGPGGADVGMAAFGARTAAALDEAGRGVMQAGEDLNKIVLAKAEMTNELMANDAQTAFMKQATALYGDYQMKTGKAAEAALPEFLAGMETLRKQALDTMPNANAKMMLERGTRYYSDRVMTQAQSHANEQFWEWHDASAKDAAAEFANQAVLAGDPNARQGFIDAGVNEVIKLGERHGLGPDEMQSSIRKYKGEVFSQIIEDQALDGNPQGAAALLHDYAGQMDSASVLEVRRKLQPLLEDDTYETMAKALTGQTAAPAAHGVDGFDNNVGNLRYSKANWSQKGAPHNGFETFATPEAGVRAAIMNLAGYGDVTLEQAIYKWAPPSENDTEAYVARMEKATGIDRDSLLPLHSVDKMAAFMKEMTRIEKGKVAFSDDVFRKGAESAINGTPLPDAPPSALNAPEPTPEQKARTAATIAEMGPTYDAAAAAANSGDPGDFPSRPLPERGDVYRKAIELTEGNPKGRAKLLGKLATIYSQDDIVNQSARRQLAEDMRNLTAQAEDGVPDLVLPEGRIRALFPPEEAQGIIDDFKVSNTAGQIFAATKWMAPEDRRAAYDRFVGEPDRYEQRSKLAAKFRQIEEQRQKALLGTPGTGEGADPAGYVQDNPLVKATRDAIPQDMSDPAAVQNYATTVLDVQAHVGVPRVKQHILTAGNAESLSAELQKPNADVRGTLEALKRTWGSYYPQVFADLQTLGKLPGGYAVAEAMADPQARTAAYDALKIPAKELKASIPEQDRKTIDNQIEDPSSQLAVLGRTFGNAGNGSQTVAQIKEMARATAYRLWSLNGGSADAAAKQAIAAVTDQKYDFVDDDRARVPKGMRRAVETAADYAIDGLQAQDMVIPGDPATLEQLRADPEADKRFRDVRLREVRLGHWVTNERDNGLYRVDMYGAPVMITSPRWRGAQKRMEIFFDQLPQPGPEARAPQSPYEGAGAYGIGVGPQ